MTLPLSTNNFYLIMATNIRNCVEGSKNLLLFVYSENLLDTFLLLSFLKKREMEEWLFHLERKDLQEKSICKVMGMGEGKKYGM